MDQNKEIRNISFNIFARDDGEARRGEQAIKDFIALMCEKGVKVTGDKIAEAFGKLKDSPFVLYEMIKFFSKK